MLPDVSFRGEIDEDNLKDDTCAKEEDSRGEYSEVVVDRVVKENGNVENYCEKDYDDTDNMGDGSKDKEHQDGSSMEDHGTKEENHEDGGSMIDDDNADDTSVSKEEANDNGGRDVKEHTDM